MNTASETRFQYVLPLEPVNRARLERLRAERAAARAVVPEGSARFEHRRRQAQIAARAVLQRIGGGLADPGLTRELWASRNRALASALHAAELQFPESWLPFVVSQS